MSSYVELHCHSAFSLLDGASLPDALVARAVELGLHALALTDHDDLGGIVSFAQAARSAGIEGIVGGEVTVTRGSGLGTRDSRAPRGARVARATSHAAVTPAATRIAMPTSSTSTGAGPSGTAAIKGNVGSAPGRAPVSVTVAPAPTANPGPAR